MRAGETEAGLQAAIMQVARLHGWICYHTHDARRSPAGFPDLVLARPDDAVIFAELKLPQRAVTPTQRHWHDVLTRCTRVETYLWTPEHWDTLLARLSARGGGEGR